MSKQDIGPSPEQMARDVIAAYLAELHKRSALRGERQEAGAILARLAAHDPPLVIVTGDVVKQRDALHALCNRLRSTYRAGSETHTLIGEEIASCFKNAEKPKSVESREGASGS